jgi:hypothetical protein
MDDAEKRVVKENLDRTKDITSIAEKELGRWRVSS